MEKAGSREAYGSVGDPSETGPGAGAVRVPPPARAADQDRARRAPREGAPRDADAPAAPASVPAEGPVRGEHTHSETPIPHPRATRTALPVAPEAPAPETRRAPTNAPGGADVSRAPGEPGASGVSGAPGTHGVGGSRAVPAACTASAAAFPRPVVQRASVRGQILDALRAALVSGELAPGEVYSAPALGERFGVSATPVREAMQQLAVEGAVEVVPNRGFRVVERGARELAELAEIRGLIEAPVLLRLARTLPADHWEELRPLAEETARAAAAGCRATYAEADRAFHRALLALAGNEQLVRIADDLHRRAQWPLGGSPTARARLELMADAEQHLSLLDALSAQDLSAVEVLLREHFVSV